MIDRPFHLAIETSSRVSSVTLGDAARELGTTVLPPQQRHTVDLLPTIDALCRTHQVDKSALGLLMVSIGPGSFTGLRVGLAAAKLLAEVLDLNIVAVPTIQVLAYNVPRPPNPDTTLAVCLNLKKDSVYSQSFGWRMSRWVPLAEPQLRPMADFVAQASRPTLVLGDPLPGWPSSSAGEPPAWLTSGVTVLPPDLAVPRSQAVRTLGLEPAARAEFVSADALLPLYVRPPEAQELWDKRKTQPPQTPITAHTAH